MTPNWLLDEQRGEVHSLNSNSRPSMQQWTMGRPRTVEETGDAFARSVEWRKVMSMIGNYPHRLE